MSAPIAGCRSWLCVVVCCFSLIACSTPAIQLTQAGLAKLDKSHTIANLPYFPQQEDQCGPASLATMLGARGIAVTPQQLRSKVYIPARQGSLTTELVARARRHGMLVYPLRPQLPDMLQEVADNNPVLVLQNLSYNWLPRWHFSVVIGYDLEHQTLTLRSGQHLAYTVAMPLFLKTWQRAGSWAVVITEPSKLPASAQLSAFLSASNKLEQVGEMDAALTAYMVAQQRWPNSAANFAAGNAAYSLARFQQARQSFTSYLRQQPDSAAGWNNLAYSLLKLQCYNEATRAINCALKLAPGQPEYIASHIEISSQTNTGNPATSCVIPACPASG